VEFRTGVEVGRDVISAELRKQGFRAFYLAIGARRGEGNPVLMVKTPKVLLPEWNSFAT
jgi:NADPH-dependent glutamate synthase beta subunit-like oxidoreductase